MTIAVKNNTLRRLVRLLVADIRAKHWPECDKCEPSSHVACRVCLKARFIEYIENWKPNTKLTDGG